MTRYEETQRWPMIEALRMAEEALDKARWSQSNTKHVHADYDKSMEALAAIRAALADTVDTSPGCVEEKQECGHEPESLFDWKHGHPTGLKSAAPVEPVKQEPVAIDWDKTHEVLCDVWNRVISADDGFDAIQDLLYTAPQPRQDVDLTDDEIDKAWRSVSHTIPYDQFRIEIARAVIAAYKEKNK